MSSNRNNSSLLIVLFIIVLIQSGVIIYLLFQLKDKSDNISQLSGVVQTQGNEIENKTKELENIKTEFERVSAEREKLGLANDSLDIQIAQLNEHIATLKKTKKLDTKKRKELETLVVKLRQELVKRDQEIAQLKAANDSLATDVNELTTANAQLGDSLSTVKTKTKEVESKLKNASVLKAEGVKVSFLKSNGKVVDDAEYKASKIDRIKVVFTLADNKAAKQETKDIYYRLKTPDGDVFSDPNNGGGYFNLSDGTPISYSGKVSVKFDNTNQKPEFYTLSGLRFVPGFYKVEIYCEGFKIGEGSFKVK